MQSCPGCRTPCPRPPNSALKAEISRIARKEAKEQTEDLRRASTQHRSHIAALRRRMDGLERAVKRASKQSAIDDHVDASAGVRRRFSATRLATARKKLGLSAADFGALVGVSGQSIYKWEAGEARPRAKQLEAIAAVRGMGKREAAAKLEAMRPA